MVIAEAEQGVDNKIARALGIGKGCDSESITTVSKSTQREIFDVGRNNHSTHTLFR